MLGMSVLPLDPCFTSWWDSQPPSSGLMLSTPVGLIGSRAVAMILNPVTMIARLPPSLKREAVALISPPRIISLNSGASSESGRLQSLSHPIFMVWRSGRLSTVILFLGSLLMAVTDQHSIPSTRIQPITSSSQTNSPSTDSGLGTRSCTSG